MTVTMSHKRAVNRYAVNAIINATTRSNSQLVSCSCCFLFISLKIVKWMVFHVPIMGNWGKFLISNNHALVEPHWLWYFSKLPCIHFHSLKTD